MSNKQPVISGKDLIKLLESHGFEVVRINGSHHRMKHIDGRVTTVPVHRTKIYQKGYCEKLFAKI